MEDGIGEDGWPSYRWKCRLMVKSAEGRVWDNGKGLSLRAGTLRRGGIYNKVYGSARRR